MDVMVLGLASTGSGGNKGGWVIGSAPPSFQSKKVSISRLTFMLRTIHFIVNIYAIISRQKHSIA